MVAQQEAADQFVAGEAKATLTPAEAKDECRDELKDEGAEDFAERVRAGKGRDARSAACEDRKIEDDEASNARTEASLAGVVTGLGIAGALGFVVALFYTCLWAMRTGLLSRFWGSLGMALGVATLLGLLPFLLIWLVYFAVARAGRVPGGRPPAWAAGEAIPWPTPGEKAAAELEPEDGWDEPEGRWRRRRRGRAETQAQAARVCEWASPPVPLDIFLYRYILLGMSRMPTTADAFNAVAEPRRREILDLLAAGERPVNDLVETTGMGRPQVSKHLRVLREAERCGQEAGSPAAVPPRPGGAAADLRVGQPLSAPLGGAGRGSSTTSWRS